VAERERVDDRPGWYKQAESEFGEIFGSGATGKGEQKALEDWAELADADRAYYQCKLAYMNLRAQYHVVRTLQAMLGELRAVAAEDEPAPVRAPRGRGREEAPPADDGDDNVRATGPVLNFADLPPAVQAEIRKHQRPAVVPDAVTPDEVIEPSRGEG